MQQQEYHRRAQTNVQLYGQLVAAGFSSDDLRGVRDAYALATRLFAGQMRPEGRPFLCHVVGVASVLCIAEAPHTTVVAGLLHSAYSHGDFGLGPGQVSNAARNWLRSRVGTETEALLASYASCSWNRATVHRLVANPPAPDSELRLVALIRLADSVEEALDGGIRLSHKTSNPNRDIRGADFAALGNALGYPELGAACERLLDSPEDATDTAALRTEHAGSYILGPSSWREKTLPRARRLLRQFRAR
jgi:hypothetical protein